MVGKEMAKFVNPRIRKGWARIGDFDYYFKSSWELKFALYLDFLLKNSLINDWEYEPQTFWYEKIKRGVRSYKPDFKIYRKDNTHYWVEVKGYMDPKSLTKIKRFKKYYPHEELWVVEKKWFVNNKINIPQQEFQNDFSKRNEDLSSND